MNYRNGTVSQCYGVMAWSLRRRGASLPRPLRRRGVAAPSFPVVFLSCCPCCLDVLLSFCPCCLDVKKRRGGTGELERCCVVYTTS